MQACHAPPKDAELIGMRVNFHAAVGSPLFRGRRSVFLTDGAGWTSSQSSATLRRGRRNGNGRRVVRAVVIIAKFEATRKHAGRRRRSELAHAKLLCFGRQTSSQQHSYSYSYEKKKHPEGLALSRCGKHATTGQRTSERE